MALIDLLAGDFDPGVRVRGKNYFDRGAVDIVRQTHRSVSAAVQADRRHLVEIDWDSGLLEYECNCDDFQYRGQSCKHIWAALLQAETSGRLPAAEDLAEMAGLPTGQATDENGNTTVAARAVRKISVWKRRLAEIRNRMAATVPEAAEPWPTGLELLYVIDGEATENDTDGLFVDLAMRFRRRDGLWNRPRGVRRLRPRQIASLPDPADRQILQMLCGAERADMAFRLPPFPGDELPRRYRLGAAALGTTLKAMCLTGRCRLRRQSSEMEPTTVTWDESGPWEFILQLARHEQDFWRVEGSFRRGDDRIGLDEAQLIVRGGAIFRGQYAEFTDAGALDLIRALRRGEKLAAPLSQGRELLAELFSLPGGPKVDVPEALGLEQVRSPLQPILKIRADHSLPGAEWLQGELLFDYAGQVFAADSTGHALLLRDTNRLIHRDSAAEITARNRLASAGFKSDGFSNRAKFLRILPRDLPAAVRMLARDGWRVEAEGRLYRTAGDFRIDVSSGIDWFEVRGTADFDGHTVALPQLLAALRKGETTIRLDDGTLGLLPEEWLRRYGLLAGTGVEEDDHLRFARSQAGLLDALLAAQPRVTFDAAFSAARQALKSFEGVRTAEAPPGFVGELRPYQKEGLGWLHFLRQFGFGGCLADDMGLGKTIQVLALLEQRRHERADGAKYGPSMVVVPKSLVFNWKEEAGRFAPKLRLLEHTGPLRDKTAERFGDVDLILTTYGTLRNDVGFLREAKFDYVILDEAQAVKNSASESAKATRLLNGSHRLVLSGTPVQNHLGELWSLLDFLNPGMLGASSAFASVNGARTIEDETRTVMARALRPFILRRTKAQVAADLPDRLEQTLLCEMEAPQRKLYDELRDHYRQSLTAKIGRDGLGKSKMMILEALLRLRQAACHPGLIDKTRVSEPSAKLETLLAQLTEVHEEGHKSLVFSQFTSLLAIVRARLDEAKLPYEYLDGKTRDRAERVARFQTDDNCKIFLVSLKAGGLGLNLTAAEYVFLLDPWWNPAVEAQAIDRAHRIGQTRTVFAYRLIAKDTVEQKVLDLQKTKRDLADAIITADNRTVANLGAEDLELLLS